MKLSGMVVENRRPVYSYTWLCEKMADRSRVVLTAWNGNGHTGLINGIRPEDGSGRCWLVTLTENGKNETIFVRTA